MLISTNIYGVPVIHQTFVCVRKSREQNQQNALQVGRKLCRELALRGDCIPAEETESVPECMVCSVHVKRKQIHQRKHSKKGDGLGSNCKAYIVVPEGLLPGHHAGQGQQPGGRGPEDRVCLP